MKFNFKQFLIFLLVFVGGSFAGGYVNSWLGITPGTEFVGYFISLIVPVFVIYLLYENYARKQA